MEVQIGGALIACRKMLSGSLFDDFESVEKCNALNLLLLQAYHGIVQQH
jgi:hypothetical protein